MPGRFRMLSLLVVAVSASSPGAAQPLQSPPPSADARFKVDLLLIVAHPDDESLISSYLTRAILDQKKHVAVIYATRGDGGGNTIGPEQAASLGAIREIEGRRATAALGIDLVWFLDGKDTPSQDVLQSLETWRHGASLEQTVRLVRLTRPEVILTWLPQFVVGENHGDHQAAGVLATEAFDLAGNPTAFPSQVAPARNPTGIGNLTEGLRPWQPKKLYFFSDRGDGAVFAKAGPRYPVTDMSAATGKPYYQSGAGSLAHHRTQGTGARLAAQAIASGDFGTYLKSMAEFTGSSDEQLILGKSLVGGSVGGDVLEGIVDGPIEWRPVPTTAETAPALSLGGPWRFYRAFSTKHGIAGATGLVGLELGVNPGSVVLLPLAIRNPGPETTVELRLDLPPGWESQAGAGRYSVPVNGVIEPQLRLMAPARSGGSGELIVTLLQGARPVGTIRLATRVLATMPL